MIVGSGSERTLDELRAEVERLRREVDDLRGRINRARVALDPHAPIGFVPVADALPAEHLPCGTAPLSPELQAVAAEGR